MDHKTIDVRGLACPLPVLRARKVLMSMAAGEILAVLSTDARSPEEFAMFCRESGHGLVSVIEKNGVIEISLQAFSARATG